MSTVKNVVFFHPDLGIGGAERLVVDAAVSLQQLGHKVTIYTSHCDPTHCFEEARDGTLDVRVRGNTLPATLYGRFKILFTILRHIHLILQIHSSGELKELKPHVFFVDQLSAGIPLLRMLYPIVPILFYCHFPDLLLVQRRQSIVKRIWRLPFDALEGWSMRGADRVVVNSEFTKDVVRSVWPKLGGPIPGDYGRRDFGIVYPCVDTEIKEINEEVLWPKQKIVLSVNRFERKKDVGLAIKAFAKLDVSIRKTAKLVVAGGYDAREQENVSYHNELVQLAESLGLKTATAKNVISALDTPADIEVLFLLSIPSSFKATLMKSARILVYTPSNEHFGIVPLEAMLAGVPVLASNSGGPLETIVDSKTGWLRDVSDIDAWTDVLNRALAPTEAEQLEAMGKAGKSRVQEEFSKQKMGKTLNNEIQELVKKPRVKVYELKDALFWVLSIFSAALALFVLFVLP